MWLLESSVKRTLDAITAKGFMPSAEQVETFAARSGDIMSTAGSVAQINVVGVLTQEPSLMAMLFGGGNTTYSGIISALAEADADPAVENITMFVDSPGGSVHGLFETIAAIEATKKPISVTSSMACSAAYAIAATAGPITATSVGSMFGSIGIVATGRKDDDVVEVTSTKAPNKRKDVGTPEGKAALVGELDALHELFADAIATGRGVTADTVNATFGEGGTLLANEAQKRGMIDNVTTAKPTAAVSNGAKQKANTMNKQELQAQYPGVYAAVLEEGVASERDRVTAHLKMGKASGAMDTALTAVEDGSRLTESLTATYLAAGMNKRDIEARQTDDAAAAAAASASEEPAADEAAREAAQSDAILATAAQLSGVELKG